MKVSTVTDDSISMGNEQAFKRQPEVPEVDLHVQSGLEIRESAKENLEDGQGHVHRTNRALTFALAAQIGKFVLGFIAMLVFARKISPEDFGLFSLGLVVFSFGSIFKDGLNLAIVQRNTLTAAQKNSLYWTTLIVGAAVTLITVVCAPLFAFFYHAPLLMPILLGLAVGQMFVFLGSFHVTMMRREMRFGILGFVEQISTLISMSIAIAAAFAGAGIWSLLIAQVLTAVGTAIGAMWKSDFRPGKFEFKPDSFEILSYGKRVTLSDVATYVVRNFDNLILGWYGGATQLGFYDRAYSITQLPMVQLIGPVGGVAHSSLSKTVGSKEQYIRDARNVISLYAVIGMSLAAFLVVAANSLLPVVLGNQWAPAIPILQVLAPSVYIDAAIMGACTLLLTNARTVEYLRLKLYAAVVGIVAICIGIKFGTVGVAAAFSLSRLFVFVHGLILCQKYTPVTWTTFCRALRPALLGSICAGVATFAATKVSAIASLPPLQLLVVETVVFFGLFRVIWGIDPDGRERVQAFRRFFKTRLRASV